MPSFCCFTLLICVWSAACHLSLSPSFFSFVAFVMVLQYRSKVLTPNHLKVKCSTVDILSSLWKLKPCVNTTRWDPHGLNLLLMLLLLWVSHDKGINDQWIGISSEASHLNLLSKPCLFCRIPCHLLKSLPLECILWSRPHLSIHYCPLPCWSHPHHSISL